MRPSQLVVVFVGHVRRVEMEGGREPLFVGLAQFLSLLTRVGVRYHTREGKRWWHCRPIP